jgi:hypothetical protein
VQDLDHQVLAPLAEHLLHLLAQHLPGTVMRIDDAVADFELDVRRNLGLQVIQVRFR